MDTQIAGLQRLSLRIQRLMDAELLREEDGAALLAETAAARQSLDAGNTEAARQLIERLAQHVEALVEAVALDITNGHAIIEAARHIAAEARG